MHSVESKTERLAANIGKWSRWIRKQGRPPARAKRSQSETAKAAEISRATLSALEAGAKAGGRLNPQLSVIVGLADAFQVEVRDLMWLAEAPVDEGLGVPSAVKRVAEALGISEMAVDAQRRNLADAEGETGGPERGAPTPHHGPPLPVRRPLTGLVDMENLAADLTALGRFSLSIARRIAPTHEHCESAEAVPADQGGA